MLLSVPHYVAALREKLKQQHGHKRAVMVDDVAAKSLGELSKLAAPSPMCCAWGQTCITPRPIRLRAARRCFLPLSP